MELRCVEMRSLAKLHRRKLLPADTDRPENGHLTHPNHPSNVEAPFILAAGLFISLHTGISSHASLIYHIRFLWLPSAEPPPRRQSRLAIARDLYETNVKCSSDRCSKSPEHDLIFCSQVLRSSSASQSRRNVCQLTHVFLQLNRNFRNPKCR